MILVWLLIVLTIGALLSWGAARISANASRWVALAACAIDLAIILGLWVANFGSVGLTGHGAWLVLFRTPWIPRFGIHFELGLDGLSLLLIALTLFLGLLSVITSWTEIREQVGFFHFNLLATLLGTLGVFLALDMFLFFLSWELMLVPMYYLIAIWGHENRIYSAIKFFIFTQASGLLMFAAILALVVVHYRNTGTLTFNYFDLLHSHLGSAAMWIMLGFFIAFTVKLPAFPFHTWLPDAHTDAPTAGSVILAGVLLKTGAYGLLRFAVPLFPQASAVFAPWAMLLAVAGIIYGGILAFAQRDFKRLVAYTSISHLGFVLLGIYAWNMLALQGAVVQMLAHGISTGALFILVGALQERIHTRDMTQMGGLWPRLPRMGAIGMFFAIASLGLPGLGNFVGEFLTLLGTYPVSIGFTGAAVSGLIVAVMYSLAWMHRVFQGRERCSYGTLADFGSRELGMMAALMIVIVWLGLYPNTIFDTVGPALKGLQHTAAAFHMMAGS
jgi:NADH-quinone oxidoreductase subunit M